MREKTVKKRGGEKNTLSSNIPTIKNTNIDVNRFVLKSSV
jgi:hypothetical protein